MKLSPDFQQIPRVHIGEDMAPSKNAENWVFLC